MRLEIHMHHIEKLPDVLKINTGCFVIFKQRNPCLRFVMKRKMELFCLRVEPNRQWAQLTKVSSARGVPRKDIRSRIVQRICQRQNVTSVISLVMWVLTARVVALRWTMLMIVNPRVLLLRFLPRVNPSTKGKGKGQGKGSKGSGKKGKMYAVCDEHGSWWYTEDFGEHVEGSDVPAAEAEGANEESPPLILNGLLPSQLHVLLGGGELSFDHAAPCDENMFDLSPIRVDMSVGDDMLFDFAFEGDTWLIEAEYDSDWLAVVQPMCGSCCASCDVVDGAWTEGFIRLDSTWCPPFVPGEEPATHTANGTVEEDVMSKSRLESEMVVPHDVDFAIFNLIHGDETCLTDGTSSDTCSVLLQSLNRGGDGYWLVDPGASVCVVTPNELKRFKHSPLGVWIGQCRQQTVLTFWLTALLSSCCKSRFVTLKENLWMVFFL